MSSCFFFFSLLLLFRFGLFSTKLLSSATAGEFGENEKSNQQTIATGNRMICSNLCLTQMLLPG